MEDGLLGSIRLAGARTGNGSDLRACEGAWMFERRGGSLSKTLSPLMKENARGQISYGEYLKSVQSKLLRSPRFIL